MDEIKTYRTADEALRSFYGSDTTSMAAASYLINKLIDQAISTSPTDFFDKMSEEEFQKAETTMTEKVTVSIFNKIMETQYAYSHGKESPSLESQQLSEHINKSGTEYGIRKAANLFANFDLEPMLKRISIDALLRTDCVGEELKAAEQLEDEIIEQVVETAEDELKVVIENALNESIREIAVNKDTISIGDAVLSDDPEYVNLETHDDEDRGIE